MDNDRDDISENNFYQGAKNFGDTTNPADLAFIINDPTTLSKFSSEQASWVGFYYGKYYCSLLEKQDQAVHHGPSLTFYDNNKYVITMITRQNEIVFYDKDSLEMYSMSPMEIMMAKAIICEFDPAQACYIGILSALCEKRMSRGRNTFIDEGRH